MTVPDPPLLIVADNLTVTDARFAAALDDRDGAAVRRLVARAAGQDVDILDLNLGYRSRSGPGDAAWLIRQVAEASDLPLCMDTADPITMRSGLETAGELGIGIPIINSFTLDPGRAEAMLSLAVEYGASIVGFCVSDAIPRTVDDRLEAAAALVALADEAGVPRERLFIDPILLAFTSFQDDAGRVLDFLRALPDLLQPPVRTLAALSNLTYGLDRPHRTAVQSAFLAMAVARGLDAVMVNAHDRGLGAALRILRAIRMERLFAPAELEADGPDGVGGS